MNDIRIAIIVTFSLLLVSSSFSVATRTCRSYFIGGRLSWHDLLIFIALIGTVILGCIVCIMTMMGLGEHETGSELSKTRPFQQLLAMANLCYFVVNLCVKLGSLFTYLRFALDRAHVLAINALQFITLLFGLASILTVMLRCVPMSAAWSDTSGICIDTPLFFLVTAAITVTINVFLYIMPLWLTWRLHAPRSEKFCVQLVFALGTSVIVASVVRLWYVHSLASQQDLSYTWAIVLLSSAAENHLAILVACAPAIRSLITSSVVPRMRNALSSGADKLRSLSTSLPSTDKPMSGTMPASPLSIVVGEFEGVEADRSIWSRLKSLIKSSRHRVFLDSIERDPDIESMDFHDNIPNPLPRVHTLEAFRDPPPSPTFRQDEKFPDEIRCSMSEIFFDDILPGLSSKDLNPPVSLRANPRLSTSSSLVLSMAHPGTEIVVPPPAILTQHPCNEDCRHLPRAIEFAERRSALPPQKYGQPSLEIQRGSRPVSFGYADVYL